MIEKNILIIDDDKNITYAMSEIITKILDYVSVEIAHSSNEAFEKIKPNNFDLIFLDINLGEKDIDGLEILKQIKKIYPNQKIYMITGFSINEETESFIEKNSLGLFLKPFRLKKLVNIVREVLSE